MKTLLDTARSLNSAIEQNYLALAVALVEVEETKAWEGQYESFVDFYENDLRREKSTVSRLLKAGHWLKDNYGAQLPTGNVSYKRLTQAINQFPEKPAEYVLEVAKNWQDSDFRAEKKDACTEHDIHPCCVKCWKKMDGAQ